MAILNYSTEVPVSRSIAKIQDVLVAHGANAIMMSYDAKRQADGLTFVVATKHGELPFKLPANISAVQEILESTRTRGYTKEGQAARVAWRILKDWVEAQMAIVETNMVVIEEVFLPYLIQGGKTLFESLESKGFLLKEWKE